MNYKIFIFIIFLSSDLLGIRSLQMWKKQRSAMVNESEKSVHDQSSILDEHSVGSDSKADISLVPEGATLQDRAIALIDGTERRHVVCQSECNRISMEGVQLTPDTLVNDELLYQEALRYKIPIDESVAEKYISAISKQYNLNETQVNAIFKQAGMTVEQGKQELMKMYAKNSIMEHKIISRIFVSQGEIEAYCKENPLYKPAKYQLQIAVVPFTKKPMEQQKTAIVQQIKKGYGDQYEWCDAFWLNESDIADDKQFVTAMNIGDISKPEEAVEGFEIIRLVNKKEQREVPLKKRYKEVVARLREPKINEVMESYLKELHDHASITFISDSAQNIVLACAT